MVLYPRKDAVVYFLEQENILDVVLLHVLPVGLVPCHAAAPEVHALVLHFALNAQVTSDEVQLVAGQTEVPLDGAVQVNLRRRSRGDEVVLEELAVEHGDVKLDAVVVDDSISL